MSKSILNTTKYVCYRCGVYGFTEIFKDIPGYNGKYLIGSRGTVLSTEFRNNIARKKRIVEMTPTDNGNGYKIIFLRNENGRKREYIHRLVANAFIPKTDGKNVINHKDHDRSNNSVANLEWCTQRENIMNSAKLMRHEKSRCRKTATGHKYIGVHTMNGKPHYRVQIKRTGKPYICKMFSAIDDAIAYRDEVLNVKINT